MTLKDHVMNYVDCLREIKKYRKLAFENRDNELKMLSYLNKIDDYKMRMKEIELYLDSELNIDKRSLRKVASFIHENKTKSELDLMMNVIKLHKLIEVKENHDHHLF